jgi:hypothetical protein
METVTPCFIFTPQNRLNFLNEAQFGHYVLFTFLFHDFETLQNFKSQSG